MAALMAILVAVKLTGTLVIIGIALPPPSAGSPLPQRLDLADQSPVLHHALFEPL